MVIIFARHAHGAQVPQQRLPDAARRFVSIPSECVGARPSKGVARRALSVRPARDVCWFRGGHIPMPGTRRIAVRCSGLLRCTVDRIDRARDPGQRLESWSASPCLCVMTAGRRPARAEVEEPFASPPVRPGLETPHRCSPSLENSSRTLDGGEGWVRASPPAQLQRPEPP